MHPLSGYACDGQELHLRTMALLLSYRRSPRLVCTGGYVVVRAGWCRSWQAAHTLGVMALLSAFANVDKRSILLRRSRR